MPRPEKYHKEDLEALIKDKEERGIPVKKNCAEKGWPYVSVVKALKKFDIKIPRKYAETKARLAGVVVKPVTLKKPRTKKKVVEPVAIPA